MVEPSPASAVMESTVLHYTSRECYLLWHIPSQSTRASKDYHLYRIFLGKARKALLTRREKQRMAHLYPLLLSFLTNGVDKTSTYSQLQLWVEDDKCWGRRKKPQSIKQDTEHMETKEKSTKAKQTPNQNQTKKKKTQHNTSTADARSFNMLFSSWSCPWRILLLYYWVLVFRSL